MKRLASLLLMALLSFALFADSLGYAGFGLGFGFGKTSYEDSLEIKRTSLEVNIEGVFYLTEERSDVQLGIGVQVSAAALEVDHGNIPLRLGHVSEFVKEVGADHVVSGAKSSSGVDLEIGKDHVLLSFAVEAEGAKLGIRLVFVMGKRGIGAV